MGIYVPCRKYYNNIGNCNFGFLQELDLLLRSKLAWLTIRKLVVIGGKG